MHERLMKDRIKKHVGLFFLFCLISVLIFSAPSLSSPILMGRLTSVYSYGAQDVIRNPALVVWQRQDNAIGLLLDYQADINKSVINRNSDLIVDQHIDSKSGFGSFSYIRKIDMLALGCNVNVSYGLQRQNWQFYSNSNGNDTLNQEGIDTNSRSAAFTFSTGIALDSSSSLGIQVIAGYSNNESTTKRNTYLSLRFPPFSDFSRFFERSIQEQIAISPGIGYLGKIENSEIGILFTLGRLTWEKDAAKELSFDTLLLGGKVRANGELPFYFKYDVGPGLIAGAFSKLNDFINTGLEVKITFPLIYKTQFLEQFGNISPGTWSLFLKNSDSRLKLENTISSRPSVAVRGGFEFIASSNIVFALGGGITLNKTKSHTVGGYLQPSTRNDNFYQETLSVYGTGGVDFIIGKRNTITVGAILSHNIFSTENNNYQKTPAFSSIAHWYHIKTKTLTGETVLAMSFGF
jgi:hypothetical protein